MIPATAPSVRRVLSILLAMVVSLAACTPDRDGDSPTSAATIAVRSTGDPAPTEVPTTAGELAPAAAPNPADDGATAGGPAASATAHVGADTDATATATPPARAEVAAPDPEPFAMNLYRRGDHVAQYTFEWCVGASLQMALNMATDESRTTRADQKKLWEMARDKSFSPFGGANPRGWTAVLNDLGIGPYELVSLPTFEEALTAAAEAIRATKRPVGLVMWRGRHAWVMSGFEATADPRAFDEFEVTGIRVLDPLYPHGHSVWGPSPKPNSLISPRILARQFVLRDSRRVNLGVPPGYLLVLPVASGA